MERDIISLSDRKFDLVIVGAGIYGAAIAWDATLRGLSVALIDKGDFGSATTANSLKIVHGGLRYLQTLDFKRMRESIRERTILMRIAPHLIHPLTCVMPTYGYLMKGPLVMQAGMIMNDIISFDRNRGADPEKKIPAGRIISRAECMRLIPGLDGNRVTGGVVWTDAQMLNSDRLLLSFVLSASNGGAVVANYVKAAGFIRENGRIKGVKALDLLSSQPLDIQADLVINASGGWVDRILDDAGRHSGCVKLSTAMNLVVNKKMLPDYAAGVNGSFTYTRPDGSMYNGRRVLFLTPWNDKTLIGTYHRPYDGNPDDLRVTENEIEDFLKDVNSAVPADPVKREDISFFHKGFLPMEGVNADTGEVRLTKHYSIRDHGLQDKLEGLISVIGVKYTTARDVAEKTVDLAVKKLGKGESRSRSRVTPLDGGNIARLGDLEESATEKENRKGLEPSQMKRLVIHYGSNYPEVLAWTAKKPDARRRVSKDSEVLLAEIYHAVHNEMAVTLRDTVLRRTDLGSSGPPGDEALRACGRVMARELGWDRKRLEQEIDDVKIIYQPGSRRMP